MFIDDLHKLLRDFAKEYKKNYKNTPCELIIVGGSSILFNYKFRNSTEDVDYISIPQRSLKDIIYKVANKHNIDTHWMNDDFRFSSSYTPKLSEVSEYYTSYNNNTITIRTIKSKYLIAMKVQSGREFGNDISDIIGIIKSEKEKGNNITFQEIMDAGVKLYEDNFNISISLKNRIQDYCSSDIEKLNDLYNKSIKKANTIKKQIEDTVDNQFLNKATAKEIGQMLEEYDDLDGR